MFRIAPAVWAVGAAAVLLVCSAVTVKAQIEDGQAPGCLPPSGIFGGCGGKTVVKDLRIEPPLPCLEASVNNCNGGEIELYNRCGKDLRLGATVFPYVRLERRREEVYLKIYRGKNGRVTSGFEDLVGPPPKRWDERFLLTQSSEDLEVEGTAGNAKIRLRVAGDRLVKSGLPDCVNADLVNFNGVKETIRIANDCLPPVIIAGHRIRRADYTVASPGTLPPLELFRDAAGKTGVRETQGNFAGYFPEADARLSIDGTLGGASLTLSYLKTRRLCR